jgi:hypothetical protein
MAHIDSRKTSVLCRDSFSVFSKPKLTSPEKGSTLGERRLAVEYTVNIAVPVTRILPVRTQPVGSLGSPSHCLPGS